MALIRWRNFREFPDYRREVEDLFRRFLHEREEDPAEVEVHPPMNISESGGEIAVELELPGVDPKDVDVSLQGDILSVRGERKHVEKEGRQIHKQESWYGKFHRHIVLPMEISSDKVSADFKNGILRIVLPKAPDIQSKEIKIDIN
jgi:HSP20 family protein